MKILIKFPTRSRPIRFFETLDTYYKYASDISNIKFLITCDITDNSMFNSETIEKFKIYENLSVQYTDNKTKIEAVNHGIPYNGYDIILLASDDMIPIVRGFDIIIRKMMEKHFPDTDGVLWFNDGIQGMNLNTLSILGKKYFDRFGYIYHPDYKSVFCDNEFTEVSKKNGKVIYCDDIIIKHQHCDVYPEFLDDLYTRNDTYTQLDYHTWLQRRQNNYV